MSPWPGPQPQHGAGRSSRHPRCRRQGLSDHGLEGVQVGVRHGIDLPLSDAPPEIIQRIEVWGRGWPEVGGPELSEGGVEEVLHLGGCVGWSPVLLEDIVTLWVGAPQPRQNLVLEDLVVDIGIAFLIPAEEDGGHPLPVAGQNAQHHHLLWVLCGADKLLVVLVHSQPAVIAAVVELVHSEDILVRENPHCGHCP